MPQPRILQDKVLLVSVLAYFLFLGTLWGLYRTGSPTSARVTIYDAIATPGEQVEILAKFEHEGPGLFDRDLAKIEVELSFGLETKVTAITDDEGGARIALKAVPSWLTRWTREPTGALGPRWSWGTNSSLKKCYI